MNRERMGRPRRGTGSGASAAFVLLVSLPFAGCGGGGGQQQPPPLASFFVGAAPMTPLMTPGSSFPTDIYASPLVGTSWNGVIAITMSGLPSGLTANPDSFSVDTTKGNGHVPVMLTAAGSLPTGVYPFTVTGTSGSISYSLTMAVGVVEPPPQAAPLQANVLYSFSGGQDGGDPEGALISDSAGNLYGTSFEGGAYGPGTVFEFSFSNGAWQETVLHSFGDGTDGASPLGSLVFDASGNLYGVTRSGGTGTCSGGCGTVYQLTPTGSGWQETVLHNFAGGADGFNPATGLVLDNAGNIYGTTDYGGAVVGNNYCTTTGCGLVFTLTPSGTGWAYSVIHSFQGPPDGIDPTGALVLDQQGNLYGATKTGGTATCPAGSPYSGRSGCGIIFEMTSSGGVWQEAVPYSFQEAWDGGGLSGLVLDPMGNLYGTTVYGGFSDQQCDPCGSVFELTPTGNTWLLHELYYFWGGNLGYGPSSLVHDQAGNLYGVASGGPLVCDSNVECGTVFKLSQTPQGWVETAVYDFPGGAAGWWPSSATLSGGKLYGTTKQGGGSNHGAIFEISP